MTGYSDASTATTLSSPRLPASPKRMFAPVSARPLALDQADRDRHEHGRRRDRRNYVHRADLHRGVEGDQADESGSAGGGPVEDAARRGRVAADGRDEQAAEHEPGNLRDEDHEHDGQAARRHAGSEVGEAPGEARPEREEDRAQGLGTGRVAATASSWFAW